MSYPVSLNEFASKNKLNHIIAENMVSISQLQEGNERFEDLAYFCFSRAYRICYLLIEASPAPLWKLPECYEIANYKSQDKDFNRVLKAVTLTIVHILTEHFEEVWKEENKNILDRIQNDILHSYISDETIVLPGGMEILQPLGARPVCSTIYSTLHKGTDIDIELSFTEFLPESVGKTLNDVVQKRVVELVKKATDEIPVTYTEVKGHTLHIGTIPKKEFDARMKNNPNGAPDKLDLEDIEKETVDSWFEDNKEQESNLVNNNNITKHEKENADLKNQLALQSESRNDDENQKNVKQQLAEKEAIIKEMQSIIDDYSARFDPKDLKKKIVCAMTGKQHIIFVLAVLASHDRLPNSRKSMSFLMSFISSRNESTMEDYLGDAISKEECETLAKVFENEKQPFLAKIIRELPYKLERDKIDKNRAKPLKKHND